MDLGWYMTLSSGADAPVQIGFERGVRRRPGPFHRGVSAAALAGG